MTGTVFLELSAVLQTDAVVARGDMAVGDAHVLRVVDVDAVAIANLQVIQQLDAVDHSPFAADQVDRPVGTLLNSHVADGQVLHGSQRQHVRTRIEGLVGQRLQFIRVLQFLAHEGDAIAMNRSLTGDAEVLCIVGIEPQHTLTSVLTKGT